MQLRMNIFRWCVSSSMRKRRSKSGRLTYNMSPISWHSTAPQNAHFRNPSAAAIHRAARTKMCALLFGGATQPNPPKNSHVRRDSSGREKINKLNHTLASISSSHPPHSRPIFPPPSAALQKWAKKQAPHEHQKWSYDGGRGGRKPKAAAAATASSQNISRRRRRRRRRRRHSFPLCHPRWRRACPSKFVHAHTDILLPYACAFVLKHPPPSIRFFHSRFLHTHTRRPRAQRARAANAIKNMLKCCQSAPSFLLS